MKAALSDKMMFRPLSFDYPEDSFASSVEDQLMFGDGLMLTPVYTQNARGRYVYLPEDMLYIKFKSPTQRKYALLPKGYHFIDVALNEVPLFMRKNKLLPLCKPTDRTDNIDTSRLKLLHMRIDLVNMFSMMMTAIQQIMISQNISILLQLKKMSMASL